MKQLNTVDHYEYVEDVLREEDVHEKHKADRAAETGLFVIIGLILTLIHGVLLYLAVFTSMPAIIPVMIHLIVSVITGLITYAKYKSGMDVPFMVLLSVTSFVTGVFGAAGSLFAFLLYIIFSQKSLSFGEWFSLIFPPDVTSEPEEVYNRIMVGIDEAPRNYGVMPFVDVMELGSEDQKRRALSKITLKFSPRLAPAVHKALKDPSNAIRVQAATSVAKIESEFMTKLERIEMAREKEPNNLHILFALAKFYDDYAYTGLLDHEREVLNREKAIETYQSYLQHDPNNIEAWTAIGRLLFRNEKWEEAAQWFRNALDRGWKMKSMMVWYLECLYHTKKFDELRRVAKEFIASNPDTDDLPPEVRDAVRLWTS
ncbi:MAG: tetratricopeptide repeat protein [Rickettsiales bacterium]|nr:tetratricopeptide repeat protein [Rickettsiales bacterium]